MTENFKTTFLSKQEFATHFKDTNVISIKMNTLNLYMMRLSCAKLSRSC